MFALGILPLGFAPHYHTDRLCWMNVFIHGNMLRSVTDEAW